MSEPETMLPRGLAVRVAELFPDARVIGVRVLGVDEHAEGESAKEIGYGRPIRVRMRQPDGSERSIVFHTALPNDFGHDRRSDRAQGTILAFDTFAAIPRHVRALDMGAIDSTGKLVSLRDTGEFYLVTDWVDGTLYADDLRRIGRTGVATALDVSRAEALANYLSALHREPGTHSSAYTRAIRDLVGHGECIFGLVDSYPNDTPGASPERLRRIEASCVAWRWKLKDHTDRLRRTHGDFHPFNVLFSGQTDLTLLDSSRGAEGDPADDVACMAINFLFFAMEHREQFATGLGSLWRTYWDAYLRQPGNDTVLAAVAPFFAWRALVIASPLWYPHLLADDRRRIFDFVERTLSADRFDPAWGLEAMR